MLVIWTAEEFISPWISLVITCLVWQIVNAQLFLLQMDLCGLYCKTDLTDRSSIIQRRLFSQQKEKKTNKCIYLSSAAVAGSSVVNGGSTHQVLSPMAVTTFQVNPNSGQPAIIDPALISQYSGQSFYILLKRFRIPTYWIVSYFVICRLLKCQIAVVLFWNLWFVSCLSVSLHIFNVANI